VRNPGTGFGPTYCLVSKDEIVIPGMASLAVGEVALMAVDDNSAAIVARTIKVSGLSATCPHGMLHGDDLHGRSVQDAADQSGRLRAPGERESVVIRGGILLPVPRKSVRRGR